MTENQAHLTLLGENFIIAFHRVIHTIKIHSDNNQLLRESVYQFKKILSVMAGSGEFEVLVWRSRIYFQGERLLHRRKSLQLINEMIDYFSERKLKGLRFLVNASSVSIQELMAFSRFINESSAKKDPPSWLLTQLNENGFNWVEILREEDESASDFKFQKKEKVRQVYKHMVSNLREVAVKVSRQSVAGVRKTRRLAQAMVDMLPEEEALLLGLATIRDYDDYTYTHSVNVALLSMIMGKHIGLSKVHLEQLVVCGMFHDLGKSEFSEAVMRKKDKLKITEVSEIRKHPLTGVLKVLKLNAPHDLKSRIVLGPFEHHLNYDLTGYPQIIYRRNQTLFGRILRITDAYDALTSHRAYRFREFIPAEALSLMWSKAGKDYEPLLLKAFINMMGMYPVGSVLKLDTGEVCLVKAYPDEAERTRPIVLVLEKDGHGSVDAVELLDLAERNPDTKAFLRNVIKSIHPSSIGLQPSEFFLKETA